MKHRLLGALVAVLLVSGTAWARVDLDKIEEGSVVYVKVPNASLREGTSLGGPTIAELEFGIPVTVKEVSRFRLLVTTAAGEEGYISTRQVQLNPPDTGNQGIGGLLSEDRPADEIRTAAAGRGLSDTAEGMAEADAEITPQVVAAVRRMEDLGKQITEEEVDQFISEGGLNP